MECHSQISKLPHLVIFPGIGIGHLVPVAEFAKRLSSSHPISITIITTKWLMHPSQPAYTQNLASSFPQIHFVELPQLSLHETVHNTKNLTLLSLYFEKAKVYVAEILESITKSSGPISGFITELFCTTMFDITAKLDIPTYIFLTASASYLCLMMHLPNQICENDVDYKDFSLELPGLSPIPFGDLPRSIQDRSVELLLVHCIRLKEAAGILVNTFLEQEEKQIKALTEGQILGISEMPAIYTVGPSIVSKTEGRDRAECLVWLDQQPPSSVVFVSFGSMGGLSKDQIRELALGLESSGHRFLWVVRAPCKFSDSSPVVETDLSELLPEGFEIRTCDQGLVVPDWAPQIAVLSHSSIAGFVSHCGWNSILESISHGVPIVGWPLFAEQRMNRFFLVNEMKVALEVKMEGDGFVKKEEVERVVREVMAGEGGRNVKEKVRAVKAKSEAAMEEGGSSYNATAVFAARVMEHIPVQPYVAESFTS